MVFGDVKEYRIRDILSLAALWSRENDSISQPCQVKTPSLDFSSAFHTVSSTMASFRSPAIRNLISGAAPYLRASQRRWAQVHDVRFLATQQPDRILEKYKEKLARKAKE